MSQESLLLHGPFARKPKRIRTAFSPSQLLRLERAFEKNHYVVGAERKQLASSLSLSETQVPTPQPSVPLSVRPSIGGSSSVSGSRERADPVQGWDWALQKPGIPCGNCGRTVRIRVGSGWVWGFIFAAAFGGYSRPRQGLRLGTQVSRRATL